MGQKKKSPRTRILNFVIFVPEPRTHACTHVLGVNSFKLSDLAKLIARDMWHVLRDKLN